MISIATEAPSPITAKQKMQTGGEAQALLAPYDRSLRVVEALMENGPLPVREEFFAITLDGVPPRTNGLGESQLHWPSGSRKADRIDSFWEKLQ